MFKKMKQDMRETWRVGRKLGSAPNKLISQNLNEIIEGIQALERIADADAVPLLLFVLRDKDNRYLRVSSQVYPLARRALLKVKDPRAVELFLPALNDNKKEVQEVAVIALGQLRDKRAVEPLIALLNNTNWNLRIDSILMHEALLIALGQLKDVRAIPPLVARLTDKNYKVCQYAKRALKMIDPQWFKLAEAQSAVPAVIAVIWDDRQSKLREYFVEDVYEALGLIGDTRAVRPLVAILQTSNYSYAAVRPLEMLLESKAAEFDQEDLQVIAATTATGQLSHLAYDDWEEYRSPHTIYTDCQQLNQLAKQELLRRGTGTS